MSNIKNKNNKIELLVSDIEFFEPTTKNNDKFSDAEFKMMKFYNLRPEFQNEKTRPKRILPKHIADLIKASGYKIRFNIRSIEPELTDLKGKKVRLARKEALLRNDLGELAELVGIKCKIDKSMVEDAINIICGEEENTFCPFREKLESLEWDKTPRLNQEFLSNYINDENDVVAQFLKAFMIGVVAKVHDCRYQNPVLVFGGAQGIGKSTFGDWIFSTTFGEEYFSEGHLDIYNKDHKFRAGKLIGFELSESSSLSKKDVNDLKSFLTQSTFEDRLAYGRYNERVELVCSYFSTFNPNQDIFNDSTGNRRFMTTMITKINYDYKKVLINSNQLWAEAYQEYLQMVKIKPNFNVSDLIDTKKRDEINSQFNKEDSLYELLDLMIYEKVEAKMTYKDVREKLRNTYSDSKSHLIPNDDNKLNNIIRQYMMNRYKAVNKKIRNGEDTLQGYTGYKIY